MKNNMFEYMAIADIWAEYNYPKYSGGVIALYYSIINAFNKNRWRKWIHLNYDDLSRKLGISEKTIKKYLDLLSDSSHGVIEKNYDYKNHGKISIRLLQKDELKWVKINSNSDYEFLLDPTSSSKKIESSIPEPESNIKLEGIHSKIENNSPKLELNKNDLHSQFKINNVLEFYNKSYHEFPEEVKLTLPESSFNEYKQFIKEIVLTYFNHEKFEHQITPFEYNKLIFGKYNISEIREGITKILGSGGFYPNGHIVHRIINGISWGNNSKNSNGSNEDIIHFNGIDYNLNPNSIKYLKEEDRIKVRRSMYNFIKSCNKIEAIESAKIAKKILDAYKLGAKNIDHSTADNSNKLIESLEGKQITDSYLKSLGEINIKEYLSKIIINTESCSSYFKYCYATYVNKFHLNFSYEVIIKELYQISNINSNIKFIEEVKEVLDKIIERYMAEKNYEKPKLYQYDLEEINNDLQFMGKWNNHISTVNKNTLNFKL